MARLWLGFALVLIVVLTAMGWLSATAVRLDRAEAAARHRAAVDENVRLALWRMDSALAPLLAQESAHPHYFDDARSLALPAETRLGASAAVASHHHGRAAREGRWLGMKIDCDIVIIIPAPTTAALLVRQERHRCLEYR